MQVTQFVEKLQTREVLQRLGRFGLVGTLGTLLDLSLFTALHVWLGIPTLLANTLSYSAGILNNYSFHRLWTFSDRPRRPDGAQFTQFVLASLSALVLNNLLVLLLSGPLSALLASNDLGSLAAKLCATGAGMVWNFLASDLWIFRNNMETKK